MVLCFLRESEGEESKESAKWKWLKSDRRISKRGKKKDQKRNWGILGEDE